MGDALSVLTRADPEVRRAPAVMRQVAVMPVRLYRYLLSPLLPPACRFYPSCSAYAVDAILSHGVVRGGWLATRRVLRCHPWSDAGIDHVPAQGR